MTAQERHELVERTIAEHGLWSLTRDELKDRYLVINQRMGDWRSRLGKAALVRMAAKAIIQKAARAAATKEVAK